MISEKTTSFNLSSFLEWLYKQILSGDKKFSLYSKEFILYDADNENNNAKLIFLLPEVFYQYEKHTDISPIIVQNQLKQALGINFKFTILKDSKIVEVFACRNCF